MAELVGYGSSEEDEDLSTKRKGRISSPTSRSYHESNTQAPEIPNASFNKRNVIDSNGKELETGQTSNGAEILKAPLVGPQAPPMRISDSDVESSTPLSPYNSNRLAVRNLTLPPFPNLDIPSSPPGSPPPEMTQKFDNFLQLKKQGIHFNEKLADSSALKNPMLLHKLTASAGLAENDQYATALSTNLWDPTGFPDWAYKEGLAKSQQRIAEERKAESTRTQRERLDFVSAGGNESLAHARGLASAAEAKRPRAGAFRE
ncbi:MAG: hypothetical protein LQ350_003519 [Teloschistes chrysophthalmus]|nr:MAG: hypothetical protein LQ350_003519 [Niorma chrysophthalma]